MLLDVITAIGVIFLTLAVGVVIGVVWARSDTVLDLLAEQMHAARQRDDQITDTLCSLKPYISMLTEQARKMEKAFAEGASTQDNVALLREQLRESRDSGILPDYLYDRYMKELEGKIDG